MSSNLTGTFISNTYQKIIQIDSDSVSGLPIDASVGSPDTSKFTILNGLGEIKTSVAIDSSGNTNGGLFLKNTNGYGNVFGIQVSETLLGEKGLNFFKPISSTEKRNADIFLKSTGSVWVGYGKNILGNAIVGTPSIPLDVVGYDFYVKTGVQVGITSSVSGKINIVGIYDPFSGFNTGLLINGYRVIRLVRYIYNQGSEFESFRKRTLRWPNDRRHVVLDDSNTYEPEDILPSEWSAVVVGFNFGNSDGRNIDRGGCLSFVEDGKWRIGFTFANESGDAEDQDWVIDIMFIRVGVAIDYRPNNYVNITSTVETSSDDEFGIGWGRVRTFY